MTNDEYQNFVYELANHKTSQLSSQFTHMLLGIVSEAGELADAAKKAVGYGQYVDMDNVVEELGDLLFYLTGMAEYCGYTLEDLMEDNTDKLKKRYPNGYTDKDAIERKDKV